MIQKIASVSQSSGAYWLRSAAFGVSSLFVRARVDGVAPRSPLAALSLLRDRDQCDGGEDHDDVVAQRQRLAERRHERIARGGLGMVLLIRKRTMHHAETSLASLSRLADVAVLAL